MIGWNDRRVAKKAQRVETRKNIAAMAKAKTLRATTKSTPGQKAFNKEERAAVKSEAQNVAYADKTSKDIWSKPNASHYREAAKRVEADPENYTGYGAESAQYYRTGVKPKKGK